jgi:HEAT repeat protein
MRIHVGLWIRVAVLASVLLLTDVHPCTLGITKTDRLLAADSLSLEMQALVEKLQRPSADDRAAAARLLGGMGTKGTQAIPALMVLLADSRPASGGDSVADVASTSLAKMGEPAARACLLALIENAARKDAEWLRLTISRFHDEESIKTLTVFTEHADSSVRHTAVAALNKSTDSGIVPALIGRFKDGDFYVKYAAITHFRNHRDEHAVQPLLDALTDKNASIRCEAVRALGVQADDRATPGLIERLRDDGEEARTRSAAAESLGRLRDPGVLEVLLKVVEGEGGIDDVRLGAVRGLGYLADNRASAWLREAVRDGYESSSVRIAAAKSLAQTEGKIAYPMITDVVTDATEEPLTRFWVAIGLVEVTGGEIDNLGIVDALEFYDHERYPILRKVAEDAARKAFGQVIKAGANSEVRSAARVRLSRFPSGSK